MTGMVKRLKDFKVEGRKARPTMAGHHCSLQIALLKSLNLTKPLGIKYAHLSKKKFTELLVIAVNFFPKALFIKINFINLTKYGL